MSFYERYLILGYDNGSVEIRDKYSLTVCYDSNERLISDNLVPGYPADNLFFVSQNDGLSYLASVHCKDKGYVLSQTLLQYNEKGCFSKVKSIEILPLG